MRCVTKKTEGQILWWSCDLAVCGPIRLSSSVCQILPVTNKKGYNGGFPKLGPGDLGLPCNLRPADHGYLFIYIGSRSVLLRLPRGNLRVCRVSRAVDFTLWSYLLGLPSRHIQRPRGRQCIHDSPILQLVQYCTRIPVRGAGRAIRIYWNKRFRDQN
jgi:hypothetical protein